VTEERSDMSDTPRTDAIARVCMSLAPTARDMEKALTHARQLERELDKALLVIALTGY
jgi:hypothetical protein